MKVLMVLTTPFNDYGIGSVIKNYLSEIKMKNNIQLLCASGITSSNAEFCKNMGYRVINLNASRLKKPLVYYYRLCKLIKTEKYDIIHVHGNSGTMYLEIHAAMAMGVQVRIAHCHNTSCKYKFIHYLFKNKLSKDMTVGLSCSENAGKWCFSGKFNVLNNAIKTVDFQFDEDARMKLRKQFNLEDKIVLLNVGRLSKQKNQMYMLEILPSLVKEMPNVVLVMVGDGEQKEELMKRSEALNISKHVKFLGKRNNIQKLLSMADLFVFPSIYEGLGVALIEAQANGLKCIASTEVPKEANVSGIVEYIPLINTSQWIKSIKTFFLNTAYNRSEMSKNSIIRIKQCGYDIEENSCSLLKIYSQE